MSSCHLFHLFISFLVFGDWPPHPALKVAQEGGSTAFEVGWGGGGFYLRSGYCISGKVVVAGTSLEAQPSRACLFNESI